jgi:hypothetical protein
MWVTLQYLSIKKQNTLQFQTFQKKIDANIFVEDNFSCLDNFIQNTTLGLKKIKSTNDHPQIVFYMNYISSQVI